MELRPFFHSRMPAVESGPGALLRSVPWLASRARKIFIVRGGKSLDESGRWEKLLDSFHSLHVHTCYSRVTGEPTVESVDSAVQEARDFGAEAVLAVGGGSVVDAGKAVAAMATCNGTVEAYLEGVGWLQPTGEKLLFAAAPTTAGTGSEATKNAVITRYGEKGFKKSLRHENFIPDLAILDPTLAIGCPSHITAACGLDALTQLLEAFVSTKATPFTDAVCEKGLELMGSHLLDACNAKGDSIEIRASLGLAAFFSGVGLANAGLGTVHGFASPMGCIQEIPHGLICGILVPEVCARSVEWLLQNPSPVTRTALARYARVNAALRYGNADLGSMDAKRIPDDAEALVELLKKWKKELGLGGLRQFGFAQERLEEVIQKTDNRNNPAPLPRDVLQRILQGTW